MSKQVSHQVIPDEIIMNQIYYMRGHKVMLDTDLAELYEVENKQIKGRLDEMRKDFPTISYLN